MSVSALEKLKNSLRDKLRIEIFAFNQSSVELEELLKLKTKMTGQKKTLAPEKFIHTDYRWIVKDDVDKSQTKMNFNHKLLRTYQLH